MVVVAKESIFLDEVYKQNKTRSYCAGNGSHSTHNFILGLPGENLKFDVPVGVTIYRDDGKKIGTYLLLYYFSILM